jgi:hypothetical protein
VIVVLELVALLSFTVTVGATFPIVTVRFTSSALVAPRLSVTVNLNEYDPLASPETERVLVVAPESVADPPESLVQEYEAIDPSASVSRSSK